MSTKPAGLLLTAKLNVGIYQMRRECRRADNSSPTNRPMPELQYITTGPRGVQVLSEPTQEGIAGTLRTLAFMARSVKHDARRNDLLDWVRSRVVRNVPGHDFGGEIKACFDWARDQIRYRKDPADVERVPDLVTTLNGNPPSGDCVAKSVALATMLALLGHKPFFMVLGQRPYFWQDPAGEFDHVYCGVDVPAGTIYLDPTPEISRPGREYGNGLRAKYLIFS